MSAREPILVGRATKTSWLLDPRHLGIVLARYKFVAKMLTGLKPVAEIGCGDGIGAHVVRQEVDWLDLYDIDPVCDAIVHDITAAPLPTRYRAIYMLDVLEHILPDARDDALSNVKRSLTADGVFIVGCPSLESQVYASPASRAGHVSCVSGEDFRAELLRRFGNVFMFGMSDETVHTGFLPMCHYLLALCTERR